MLQIQYTIPIGELTGVLQTDLLMPVTKSDQMVMINVQFIDLILVYFIHDYRHDCMLQMILNAYGRDDDEVDVRALLSDAG